MRRLILAGGGHGHVNVISKRDQLPADLEVLLITNNKRQYYSGMLPAYVEDIYDKDDISFNMEELCRDHGIRLVLDQIIEIHSDKKTVITENGEYPYDYLSMNLGSTAVEAFDIDPETSSYVKPIQQVVDFKEKLDQEISGSDQRYRLLIIGAGASGIELALAFNSQFDQLEIEIIAASDRLLPIFNDRTRSIIEKELKKKNITIHLDERLLKIEGQQIRTDKNLRAFDYLLICNGVHGVPIQFTGFDTTDENYVLVDEYLMADESSLAMGDMIQLIPYPDVPKAGVYAIRQAPILFENLKKLIEGRPLEELQAYQPQHTYLQIINGGHQQGIANYGPFALKGKWAWKLKDKIDKDYMNSRKDNN